MIKYIVISLAAVFSNYALAQPLDQIPMYGGQNRTAVSDLKAADEKLIADTTKHYGSKEKASNAFVSNGFAYYSRNDSANAMRRFNQAWLIDPSNPEVYWGFGAMMNDLDRHCEAKDYFEKHCRLANTSLVYPDGARAITLCAVQNKNITESDRLQMFARADALYKEALERDIKKNATFMPAWRQHSSDVSNTLKLGKLLRRLELSAKDWEINLSKC
jgi:tetratricopeptide (TPR) repeat protein